MTAQITQDIPRLDVDFVSREFVGDPFPVMEEIRALGPVVYNGLNGGYMVTGYRDCAKVFGNARMFHARTDFFVRIFGDMTIEAYDTPYHDEVRGVWAEDFHREELVAKQTAVVERVVEERLAPFVQRLRAGETVDAIPALVRHIPTLVIADMLAIEPEHIEEFSAWSDAMGAIPEGGLDPTERGRRLVEKGMAATARLNEYMRKRILNADAAASGDLVTKMATSEVAKKMPLTEIMANSTQLVFAGNETTAKLMAHILVTLAQHPDQRRAIVEDRSLIPQAIEEVHRWQVVSQENARIAAPEGAEVQGVAIPGGAEVKILVGAANRDPSRWEDPHTFDIFREPRQHIGFGFGMHSCIGLNLARLETTIWLDRFLDELPEYELAGDIDYGTNFVLRGPLAVPIRVGRS